jgi:hypothetical protein
MTVAKEAETIPDMFGSNVVPMSKPQVVAPPAPIAEPTIDAEDGAGTAGASRKKRVELSDEADAYCIGYLQFQIIETGVVTNPEKGRKVGMKMCRYRDHDTDEGVAEHCRKKHPEVNRGHIATRREDHFGCLVEKSTYVSPQQPAPPVVALDLPLGDKDLRPEDLPIWLRSGAKGAVVFPATMFSHGHKIEVEAIEIIDRIIGGIWVLARLQNNQRHWINLDAIDSVQAP